MHKDKITEILGDLTVFVGLLILQSNNYDEEGTHKDKLTYSSMMSELSKALELTPEDVITITTYAENDLKRRMSTDSYAGNVAIGKWKGKRK